MIKHFKQFFAFHLTNILKDQRGAAALVVFLIILAISVIVVSTTALIGVDNLTIGFSHQASSDIILSAESCVEEAIVRLSRDNTYIGGILPIGDVECTIVVTGESCGACTIDVEAVGNSFTRNIRASVIVSGSNVDIIGWREVE